MGTIGKLGRVVRGLFGEVRVASSTYLAEEVEVVCVGFNPEQVIGCCPVIRGITHPYPMTHRKIS